VFEDNGQSNGCYVRKKARRLSQTERRNRNSTQSATREMNPPRGVRSKETIFNKINLKKKNIKKSVQFSREYCSVQTMNIVIMYLINS
ncbi:hypothetical protein GcC1_028038, partial [Golovinomyces cichoracearum]